MGIAVLCFVWFSSVLGRALDAPLVLAAGTLTGALLLGADMLWAATAITVQHERGFLPLFALLGWVLVASLRCLRPHARTRAR